MKNNLLNVIDKKINVLYTLLFTQAISLVGTRMTTIALGIWLYQKTGKTMDLLLIPLFNELPSLLFGHIIGTFIDRHDRKQVMIFSDLGQAMGTLLLFISIGSGQFHVVHLYVVVFLQGVFSSAQEPAADSSVALLTTPDNRTKVNGIKELSFPAAGILAPVLAGVIYVNLGIKGVIVIDLLTFLVATLIMLILKLPKPEVSKEGLAYSGSFLSELRGGYGFIRGNRGLFLLILYMAVVNFVLNGPLELVIPYILEITGSELILSTMLSLMSIATALTALLMSLIKLPKTKIPLILFSMCLTGTGLILFGMTRKPVLLGAALFLLMMPLPLLNVVFKTILQEKVPSDIQGRVFASAYQMAYGIAPLSFLIVGRLVDNLVEPLTIAGTNTLIGRVFGSVPGSGMGLVLTASGLLILLVTLVFSLLKTFRTIESNMKSYN